MYSIFLSTSVYAVEWTNYNRNSLNNIMQLQLSFYANGSAINEKKKSVFSDSVSWGDLFSSNVKSFKKSNSNNLGAFNIDSEVMKYNVSSQQTIRSMGIVMAYNLSDTWNLSVDIPFTYEKRTTTISQLYSSQYSIFKKELNISKNDEKSLVIQKLREKRVHLPGEVEESVIVKHIDIRNSIQIGSNYNSRIMFLNTLSFPLEKLDSHHDIYYDPNNEPTLNIDLGVYYEYYLAKNIQIHIAGSKNIHWQNQVSVGLKNEKQEWKYINDSQLPGEDSNYLLSISKKYRKVIFEVGGSVLKKAKTLYRNKKLNLKYANSSELHSEDLFAKVNYLLAEKTSLSLLMNSPQKVFNISAESTMTFRISHMF